MHIYDEAGERMYEEGRTPRIHFTDWEDPQRCP